MTSWRTAGTPTLRCYHHGKIYIGDSFALGYDGRFFLAERDRCVEWDDPQPLAEKDEACALADRAAEALEQLKGAFKPADAEDLSRRVRLLQLTCRSYRALVAALVARGRQIYQPSPANLAALHSAIDELESAGEATSKAFSELEEPEPSGNTPRQRQPGILVQQFARAFRADVPNLPRREIVMSLDALRTSASFAWRSSRRAVRGCWRSRANGPGGDFRVSFCPWVHVAGR